MLKYEVVYLRNVGMAYNRHGIHHKINGPSVSMIDWELHWHQYGRYHREDGPAYISSSGYRYYFLHDKKINGIIFKITQFIRKFI